MTTLSKARQNALYADTVVNVKDYGAVGDGVTDGGVYALGPVNNTYDSIYKLG